MATKRTLSIDGGGIHGIIPACALVKLEETTGKLTRETVDFVGGTSTGAIITAGVALGIPAKDILNIYVTRGPEIFKKAILSEIGYIWHGYQYSIQTLHNVLAEVMGADANRTLNSLTNDVVITAVRVPDGMPWYFVRDRPADPAHNRKQANSCQTGNLRLVDCVTASAAAPTFFQPWPIASVGPLVDGGVGVAGNPVYQECVEAFKYTYPDEYVPEETIVVSLGTGSFAQGAQPGNILEWVKWFSLAILHATNDEQTKIVQRHFPLAAFYRIDTALQHDIGLDDVGSIGELVQVGQRLASSIDWGNILAGDKSSPFLIT